MFFVGEALGYEEYQRSECFVGAAGAELHRWIDNSSLSLEDCFFYNVVGCRPPNNRKPTPSEIDCCSVNLDFLLRFVQPAVIACLGGTAVERILSKSGITKLFNAALEYRDFIWSDRYNATVVPMLHPSYILQYASNRKQDSITVLNYVHKFLEGRISSARFSLDKVDYRTVVTLDDLKKFFTKLGAVERFFFDVESTDLNIWNDVVGIGFCWQEGYAYYLPLLQGTVTTRGNSLLETSNGEYTFEDMWESHARNVTSYIQAMQILLKKNQESISFRPYWDGNQESVYAGLRELFKKSEVVKGAQAAKFDSKMIYSTVNVFPTRVVVDPTIMDYLSNPEKKHGLDSRLSELPELIGYTDDMSLFKDAFNKHVHYAPIPVIAQYCCGDCDAGFRLTEKSWQVLTPKQQNLYREMYPSLMSIYGRVECLGFKFDMIESKRLEPKYTENLVQISKMFEKQFKVNPGSSPEILTWLKKKGTSIGKRTAKNNLSTDRSVMLDLLYSRDSDEELKLFCRGVLDYRGFTKMHGTYITGIREDLSPEGRLHPSFNFIPRTGRLSSDRPNMQNFPIKPINFMIDGQLVSYDVRELRGQVVPDEGTVWLASDYRTLEVCVLAHLSQDKALIQACLDDIHKHAASWINSVPLDKVTSLQRKNAKGFVFGGLYGGSAYGLTAKMNEEILDPDKKLSVDIVEKQLYKLLNSAPQSQEWIKCLIADVREKGYVENPFGRIRYISQINSSDRRIRAQGERYAVNTMIQGTASDIVQFAFIEITRSLKKIGFANIGWPLFTIHDEVLTAVIGDFVDDAKELVQAAMVDNYATRFLDIDFLGVESNIFPVRWGNTKESS